MTNWGHLQNRYGTNNYKITLDRIGHAGGNPFTLAAYITFTRTPK